MCIQINFIVLLFLNMLKIYCTRLSLLYKHTFYKYNIYNYYYIIQLNTIGISKRPLNLHLIAFIKTDII